MLRKNLKKLFLLVFVITIVFIIWVVKSAPTSSKVLESIPPYANSKFLHNYRTTLPDDYPGNGKIFESNDDSLIILAYYESKLISLGWTITKLDKDFQEGFPLRLWAKKDQFNCTILVENTNPQKITVHVSRF